VEEGIEQCLIKVPNTFVALKDLGDCKDINRAWREYGKEHQNLS
jgi:hypothetical protein